MTYDRRRTTAETAARRAATGSVAPGRRTLTMGLSAHSGAPEVVQQRVSLGERGEAAPGDDAYIRNLLDAAIRPDLHDLPVQHKAGVIGGNGSERGDDADRVRQAASIGIGGSAGPLPHLDAIQRSFGHHSVAHVQAHTDGAAQTSAHAMGAEAFATGTHVAFAGTPSLHTAAHEAAHVVQQAGGVHLAGGIGEVGDAYEGHADAVADRVVRGESAEALLDEMAGGSGTGAPSGVVQRVKWDGWEANMKHVPPDTASKAKLGMAIVNSLRDRGVVARIGGSLSAAMFGGRRQPRDIDIDIPAAAPPPKKEKEDQEDAPKISEIEGARSLFQSMIGRKNMAFATGTELFFIANWSKTSEGYRLQYHHVQTERELDLLEDDEELEAARKSITQPPGEVSVDFTSEAVFKASGINVGSTLEDPGYYGPDFLIASYLNRLATNVSESKPDEKGDRDQVAALLAHHIKSIPQEERPKSASEVKLLIAQIQESLLARYISKSNPRAPMIAELFTAIMPAVVSEVCPAPPRLDLDVGSMEDSSRNAPSLHETSPRQQEVPAELVEALSTIVLKPLKLNKTDENQ